MKDKLPVVNIKGKEYVLVKDRVLEFHKLYPNGRITTELISYYNGKVIMRATAVPEVTKPERYFQDYSQEDEKKGMINATSALENCSTSAVGRVLALMGIGIVDSIASADEMVKSQRPYVAPQEEKSKQADDGFTREVYQPAEPIVEGAKTEYDTQSRTMIMTKVSSLMHSGKITPNYAGLNKMSKEELISLLEGAK